MGGDAMPVENTPFAFRLNDAVLGRRDRPLVFLGNFEVEEQWAGGECSLPRVSSPGTWPSSTGWTSSPC
jgi:hypothetical protein